MDVETKVRSPFLEHTQTPESFTVPNGQLYLTREDGIVQIDRTVHLEQGECLTFPLRLDLLSPQAQQIALHPNAETSLRSKLAHIGLESNYIKFPNSEERALSITNYGHRDVILQDGLFDAARFFVRGQELRDEELEEVSTRIGLKEGQIDFWKNVRGEQGLSFPLTHRYHPTELRTPVKGISSLPTPRLRTNLINHFGIKPRVLNGHPSRSDSPMIIAGTGHLELPEDIGMVVVGALHENGEISEHGNATIMDPNTKWSMNVEVFSAHDSPPKSAEAKVYYVNYV